MKIFAAIDIGSYETGMKIFQISKRNGLKQLDFVRHRVELGTDTYRTGRISNTHMDELCSVLEGFNQIMASYKVDDYVAYGTSALREAESTMIILDQIRIRTGLNVKVLSNSEQRFLDYKSVALKGGKDFDELINHGTLFIDIGGGSTQVSIFEKGILNSTVNLPLGILKIRSLLRALEPGRSKYIELLNEEIVNELFSFKRQYLRDKDIENLVVIDDYLPYMMQKFRGAGAPDEVTAESYTAYTDEIKLKSAEEIAKSVGIAPENASLMLPSAMLINHLVKDTGCKRVKIPGVTLSDGIAYDYADKAKVIKAVHDFDMDILSCADVISAKYKCNGYRQQALLMTSLAIFDNMKKIHGLSKRDRLLLELSARLRNVGRYVSLSSPAHSSYSIIMGTEIIGISHVERAMVANIVFNSFTDEFSYADFNNEELDADQSLRVIKLAAILHLSASLAQNPKKKYAKVMAALKDSELLITIQSKSDITLERGNFNNRADCFEEVFGIKPVLKYKGVNEI
ncbi:MAG: exopolyphosphatase [Lachnospiraceae bacterium]|nr:exopolyphosphatase [Lachnospiraceae bacterium]